MMQTEQSPVIVKILGMDLYFAAIISTCIRIIIGYLSPFPVLRAKNARARPTIVLQNRALMAGRVMIVTAVIFASVTLDLAD